jgi:hypothetical protein
MTTYVVIYATSRVLVAFHFSLCEKYIGFKLDILRLFRLEISMFSDILQCSKSRAKM